MARFLDLVSLELRRRLRDPVSLVTWLAIPFFMVALMVAVFGPGGETGLPRMTVLVVDHDRGFLGRALASAMDSPELSEYFDLQVVEEDEAKRLMDRGKASLLVIIPEEFTSGFLDNQPIELQVFRNPQEEFLPEIGEKVVRFLADAGGLLRAALQPLAGDIMGLEPGTKPSLAQVVAVSTRIYNLLDLPAARNAAAFNDLEVVQRHPEEKKLTRSQIVGWFAPGMVVVALLFLCNGQSQEIQEDVAGGRLARAWTQPTPPAVSLGAKATALIVAAVIEALVLAAALAAVLGWRPGNVAILTVHIAATAAAFTGIALLLRSMTRNPEAGGAAASGVMVGLGFLGGCFVPAVFLPAFVQRVAGLIPTGWAVQGLLIQEGATWAGDLGTIGWRIAALALTGAVTFAAAARLVRRQVVAS